MPPSSEPESPDSDPIRRPTGVRAPATMTEVFAAFMTVPPGDGDRTGGRLVHRRSWEPFHGTRAVWGRLNRTRDVLNCAPVHRHTQGKRPTERDTLPGCVWTFPSF